MHTATMFPQQMNSILIMVVAALSCFLHCTGERGNQNRWGVRDGVVRKERKPDVGKPGMALPSSILLPQVGQEVDGAAAIGNGSRLNSRLVLILAFWVTTLLNVVHFGVRNVWDRANDAPGEQPHPGENDRTLLRPLRKGGIVELRGRPLVMVDTGNTRNVPVVYKPMGSIESHDGQRASITEADSALAEEVLKIEAQVALEATMAPSAQPTHAPPSAPTQIRTAEPTQRPTVSPTVSPTHSPTPSPTARVTLSPAPAPTPAPSTLPPTIPPTAAPTAMPTVRPTPPPSEPPVAASEPEHMPAAADPAPSNTAEPTPTPSKCESLTSLEHSCLERGLEHLGGTAWDGGVVDMRINGGMANTMFDVVFGAVLADMLNYTLKVQNVLGSDHPLYRSEVSTEHCTNFTEITQMSPVYCNEIVDAFQRVSQPGHCVIVHDGYWQRYSMYQHHKDLIKPMFHVPRFDDTTYSDPGHNDIVIHARWEPAAWYTELQSLAGIQSDLFYPQLTWEYYEQILSKTAPYDKLWVVAMPELKEHALVKKLQTVYGAVVRSVDQFDDFHFLKRGRRIIMAASTFSWWAAFLSQATEIHYPLAGIFHPSAQVPDFEALPPGELTVFDEDRYIFHDLLARKWWGHFDVCSDNFVFEH